MGTCAAGERAENLTPRRGARGLSLTMKNHVTGRMQKKAGLKPTPALSIIRMMNCPVEYPDTLLS